MPHSPISRRLVFQAAGAAGLAAALGAAVRTPAAAATGARTTVTDLGPAVVQFSLMSAVLVGDTVYIGSRNLERTTVIGLHLPTGRVTATTDLTTGHSIQALAADPTGRYLYAGILQKAGGPQPNLFQWDLTTPETPARPIGRIGDRDVRDLAVAPDGTVYAVGGGSKTAPALWEYDPETGVVSSLGVPDSGVTLARAVAASAGTVFFGAGSTLGGGGDAGRACLYAWDRASRAFTEITPAEMAPDPSIRDLLVVGEQLIVSSAASTEESKVAVVDLADLSSYAIATSQGKVAKNLSADGDKVYFASETGLMVYDTTANAVSPVTFDGPALGEVWGVDCRGGKVLVTSAYGFVAEIDPAGGQARVTDLGEAGAPAAPQTAMGLAAGAGYVYVGGNGVIARHQAGGATVNMQVPGEAKDAIVVGSVLFTGQYNAQGIWRYDPRDGKPIQQVADFPSEQNRPLDVCWDEVNELVVVGAQSDTEGGGSLWTYHPRSKRAAHFINPVDDQQLVRAVATRGGVTFLGGDNTFPTGPRCTVVAFDPVAGRELWRIDPQQTAGIAALAVRGQHLYGLSRKGGLFVIDIPTRSVVHTADVSSVSNGFAAMVTNRGVVYGVSDTDVFRFHPRTFAVTAVVPGINGGWYSGSHITNDADGGLYTLRGRNLVRIDDFPAC